MKRWLLAWLAALLVSVGLATACGGKGSPATSTVEMSSGEATVASTATPLAEETPTAKAWTLGVPLRLGPGPGELNLQLYIEQGCTGCDGPPTALERVFRDSGGALQREVLFGTPAGSKYMTSTAVGREGMLYATACFGECYEVGSAVGHGYTVLYTSGDGGATWKAELPTNESRRLWGRTTLPDGSALLWTPAPYPGSGTATIFPSGLAATPPVADTFPVITADVTEPILWQPRSGGAIYRPDGSLAPLPVVDALKDYQPSVSGAQPEGGLTLSWFERQGERPVQHFGVVRNGKFVAEFVASEKVPTVQAGAWLDDHRALGNINYSTPALFDFSSGEVWPIEIYGPMTGDDTYRGRNFIIGYRKAP